MQTPEPTAAKHRVRLSPNASAVDPNGAGLSHHRAGEYGVLVSTGRDTAVVRFEGDIGATRVLLRDVEGSQRV